MSSHPATTGTRMKISPPSNPVAWRIRRPSVRVGWRRDASQRSNSALKIMFHSIAIADIVADSAPE